MTEMFRVFRYVQGRKRVYLETEDRAHAEATALRIAENSFGPTIMVEPFISTTKKGPTT